MDQREIILQICLLAIVSSSTGTNEAGDKAGLNSAEEESRGLEQLSALEQKDVQEVKNLTAEDTFPINPNQQAPASEDFTNISQKQEINDTTSHKSDDSVLFDNNPEGTISEFHIPEDPIPKDSTTVVPEINDNIQGDSTPINYKNEGLTSKVFFGVGDEEKSKDKEHGYTSVNYDSKAPENETEVPDNLEQQLPESKISNTIVQKEENKDIKGHKLDSYVSDHSTHEFPVGEFHTPGDPIPKDSTTAVPEINDNIQGDSTPINCKHEGLNSKVFFGVGDEEKSKDKELGYTSVNYDSKVSENETEVPGNLDQQLPESKISNTVVQKEENKDIKGNKLDDYLSDHSNAKFPVGEFQRPKDSIPVDPMIEDPKIEGNTPDDALSENPKQQAPNSKVSIRIGYEEESRNNKGHKTDSLNSVHSEHEVPKNEDHLPDISIPANPEYEIPHPYPEPSISTGNRNESIDNKLEELLSYFSRKEAKTCPKCCKNPTDERLLTFCIAYGCKPGFNENEISSVSSEIPILKQQMVCLDMCKSSLSPAITQFCLSVGCKPNNQTINRMSPGNRMNRFNTSAHCPPSCKLPDDKTAELCKSLGCMQGFTQYGIMPIRAVNTMELGSSINQITDQCPPSCISPDASTAGLCKSLGCMPSFTPNDIIPISSENGMRPGSLSYQFSKLDKCPPSCKSPDASTAELCKSLGCIPDSTKYGMVTVSPENRIKPGSSRNYLTTTDQCPPSCISPDASTAGLCKSLGCMPSFTPNDIIPISSENGMRPGSLSYEFSKLDKCPPSCKSPDASTAELCKSLGCIPDSTKYGMVTVSPENRIKPGSSRNHLTTTDQCPPSCISPDASTAGLCKSLGCMPSFTPNDIIPISSENGMRPGSLSYQFSKLDKCPPSCKSPDVSTAELCKSLGCIPDSTKYGMITVSPENRIKPGSSRNHLTTTDQCPPSCISPDASTAGLCKSLGCMPSFTPNDIIPISSENGMRPGSLSYQFSKLNKCPPTCKSPDALTAELCKSCVPSFTPNDGMEKIPVNIIKTGSLINQITTPVQCPPSCKSPNASTAEMCKLLGCMLNYTPKGILPISPKNKIKTRSSITTTAQCPPSCKSPDASTAELCKSLGCIQSFTPNGIMPIRTENGMRPGSLLYQFSKLDNCPSSCKSTDASTAEICKSRRCLTSVTKYSMVTVSPENRIKPGSSMNHLTTTNRCPPSCNSPDASTAGLCKSLGCIPSFTPNGIMPIRTENGMRPGSLFYQFSKHDKCPSSCKSTDASTAEICKSRDCLISVTKYSMLTVSPENRIKPGSSMNHLTTTNQCPPSCKSPDASTAGLCKSLGCIPSFTPNGIMPIRTENGMRPGSLSYQFSKLDKCPPSCKSPDASTAELCKSLGCIPSFTPNGIMPIRTENGMRPGSLSYQFSKLDKCPPSCKSPDASTAELCKSLGCIPDSTKYSMVTVSPENRIKTGSWMNHLTTTNQCPPSCKSPDASTTEICKSLGCIPSFTPNGIMPIRTENGMRPGSLSYQFSKPDKCPPSCKSPDASTAELCKSLGCIPDSPKYSMVTVSPENRIKPGSSMNHLTTTNRCPPSCKSPDVSTAGLCKSLGCIPSFTPNGIMPIRTENGMRPGSLSYQFSKLDKCPPSCKSPDASTAELCKSLGCIPDSTKYSMVTVSPENRIKTGSWMNHLTTTNQCPPSCKSPDASTTEICKSLGCIPSFTPNGIMPIRTENGMRPGSLSYQFSKLDKCPPSCKSPDASTAELCKSLGCIPDSTKYGMVTVSPENRIKPGSSRNHLTTTDQCPPSCISPDASTAGLCKSLGCMPSFTPNVTPISSEAGMRPGSFFYQFSEFDKCPPSCKSPDASTAEICKSRGCIPDSTKYGMVTVSPENRIKAGTWMNHLTTTNQCPPWCKSPDASTTEICKSLGCMPDSTIYSMVTVSPENIIEPGSSMNHLTTTDQCPPSCISPDALTAEICKSLGCMPSFTPNDIIPISSENGMRPGSLFYQFSKLNECPASCKSPDAFTAELCKSLGCIPDSTKYGMVTVSPENRIKAGTWMNHLTTTNQCPPLCKSLQASIADLCISIGCIPGVTQFGTVPKSPENRIGSKYSINYFTSQDQCPPTCKSADVSTEELCKLLGCMPRFTQYGIMSINSENRIKPGSSINGFIKTDHCPPSCKSPDALTAEICKSLGCMPGYIQNGFTLKIHENGMRPGNLINQFSKHYKCPPLCKSPDALTAEICKSHGCMPGFSEYGIVPESPKNVMGQGSSFNQFTTLDQCPPWCKSPDASTEKLCLSHGCMSGFSEYGIVQKSPKNVMGQGSSFNQFTTLDQCPPWCKSPDASTEKLCLSYGCMPGFSEYGIVPKGSGKGIGMGSSMTQFIKRMSSTPHKSVSVINFGKIVPRPTSCPRTCKYPFSDSMIKFCLSLGCNKTDDRMQSRVGIAHSITQVIKENSFPSHKTVSVSPGNTVSRPAFCPIACKSSSLETTTQFCLSLGCKPSDLMQNGVGIVHSMTQGIKPISSTRHKSVSVINLGNTVPRPASCPRTCKYPFSDSMIKFCLSLGCKMTGDLKQSGVGKAHSIIQIIKKNSFPHHKSFSARHGNTVSRSAFCPIACKSLSLETTTKFCLSLGCKPSDLMQSGAGKAYSITKIIKKNSFPRHKSVSVRPGNTVSKPALCPIACKSPSLETAKKFCLSWGCKPALYPSKSVIV